MVRRSRLGLLFALTLAVPAALAVIGGWLLGSGTIERARADEAEAERRLHDRLAMQLHTGLLAIAADDGSVLDLDAGRRVVGPFRSTPVPPASGAPTVAEQSAGAALRRGDIAAALPWFEHAAGEQTLTPEGWLAHARALHTVDPARAHATLAAASAKFAETHCGGLPFPLLAAITGSQLDPTRSPDVAAARTWTRNVQPQAVPTVVAAITATWPALRDDAGLAALALAARVAAGFADTIAPDAPTLGHDGCVLLPHDATLAVVAATRLPQAIGHAVANLDRTAAVPEAPPEALRTLVADRVPALLGTRLSPMLTLVARGSLALALLTFIAGNLLLWQLARREVALTRLRADFVDLVSHELRTPLTALSLRAEMLAHGDVPTERQPQYLQALHHDVRRLDDQVRQILDFARLQKGGRLRLEPLAPRAVLADGVRSGRAALRLVGQQLAVDVPRELPAIAGDRAMLTRALRNLLENAAKYAPPGTTVDLRVHVRQAHLVVEIADRGPGVAAAERRTIFDPFVRGRDVAPTTAGSGLGLALVAAAARAHAGTIEVHERDGGGAVFALSVPLAREAAS